MPRCQTAILPPSHPHFGIEAVGTLRHSGTAIYILGPEPRHFGMDAEIQRPWMAIYAPAQSLNQPKNGSCAAIFRIKHLSD